MSGVFRSVLVPVELEPAESGKIALDRTAEIGDEWVAIDEWTVRALELAARVAAGGEVCIVHATHDLTGYATWMPPARAAELEGAASRYATTALAKIAERHCPGVTLRYVIEPGKPLDVILAAARKHSVDAIVIAASTRPRMNRAILGSTADKVIRLASCPVFVLPSGAG